MIRNKARTKMLVGVGKMSAIRYMDSDRKPKVGNGIYLADGGGSYKKPTYTFGCYEKPFGMVMTSAPYLRGQLEIEGKVTPANAWVFASYIDYPTYSVTYYHDSSIAYSGNGWPYNDVESGNGRTDRGFTYRREYIRAGDKVFMYEHHADGYTCTDRWATRDDNGNRLPTETRVVNHEYAGGTSVAVTQYYFIMPESNVTLHGTFVRTAATDSSGDLPGIEEAAAEPEKAQRATDAPASTAEAPEAPEAAESANEAEAAAEPDDVPILEHHVWNNMPLEDPSNATVKEIRERVYYYQEYIVDNGLTDDEKAAMRSGPYYGRWEDQPGRIFPEFLTSDYNVDPATFVHYEDGRIKPNSDGTFRFTHNTNTEGWVYVWAELPPDAVSLATSDIIMSLIQFPDPEVEEELDSGAKQFIWAQTNYAVAEDVAALGVFKDEDGKLLTAEQISGRYYPAVKITGTCPEDVTRVYLWRAGESTVSDYSRNPFELLGHRSGAEIYKLLFNDAVYPPGSPGSSFVDWAAVKDGQFELFDYQGNWGTKNYDGVWDGTNTTNFGRYLVFGISETGGEITATTGYITVGENIDWTLCLSGDTPVTMADHSACLLKDLHVGDMVLSGNGEVTAVINVSRGKFNDHHTLYTFEDGTVIDESADHRFYNVDLGYWAWLKDWRIGDRAQKVDGTETRLLSRERIDEPAECFGLWTESRDYWAGGLLSGETMANQRLLADATVEKAADMLASLELDTLQEMMGGTNQ